MKSWKPDTQIDQSATINTITSIVGTGRQVIALIRNNNKPAYSTDPATGRVVETLLGGPARVSTPIGTAPELHWIVVCGYDSQLQMLKIHDTDDAVYWISYKDFDSLFAWSVGSGLVKEALNHAGVTPRSIIY
jgi:hypothetical protein